MRSSLVAFIIFLLFAQISYSQTEGDSLKLIWENIKEPDSVRFKAIDHYYNLYRHSDKTSTLLALDYQYALAQEKKSKEQSFWAITKMGIIHELKNDFDKAFSFFNKATDLAVQLKNRVFLATVKGNMGIVFAKQQKYEEATQYYSSALKIFQEEKYEKGEINMLNNLGGIFTILENYDLALEYYNKSLLLNTNRGVENTKTAILMLNIGSINSNLKLYEESLSAFNKALDIYKKKKDTVYQSVSYVQLAKTHHKMGQLDKAYHFANKSKAINEKFNLKIGNAHANLIIAKIEFKTNVKEATRIAESVLANLPSGVGKNVKKELYQLLYECYKSENKMSSSLEMHELYTAYKDSIDFEKNNFAIAREVVKNDYELKLYENKLKNEKAQSQLKLRQLKTSFLIISTSIILIAGILLYFRFIIAKNRKKREQLLEELEQLKTNASSKLIIDSDTFKLNRKNIETSISRKLNETDWNVLTILLNNPEITNKDIANSIYMSVDGIGSSLRRMYDYFDIKETKYKKIALLKDVIKRSRKE